MKTFDHQLTLRCIALMCMIHCPVSGHTQSLPVKAKVFLQGAWSTTSGMRTSLTQSAAFPADQPFIAPPFYYPGGEHIDTVSDSLVDWVLLELRTTIDTVVGRRAALLMQSGNIRDTSLAPGVMFEGIDTGYYYLVVKHRNHLPVMSATPVLLPNMARHDFSDTLRFRPYGNTRKALIELDQESFGLIAGDVDQNCAVRYSGPGNDRLLIFQRIISATGVHFLNQVVPGYYAEDLNMDGQVKYSGPGNDQNSIIQSIVRVTGSGAITGVFDCNVPVVRGDYSYRCGLPLIDTRDQQQYPTVMIGNQCWMAKNLDHGMMVISMDTGGIHSDVSDNGIVEKYCYDNDAAYCLEYGGLYDWNEMMDYDSLESGRGICPEGWHVPARWEYDTLVAYLGGVLVAGGQLKEADTLHWNAPNTGATNSTGFTALPSGLRASQGMFGELGTTGYWWHSTHDFFNEASLFYLKYDRSFALSSYYRKADGLSVRCIRDSTVLPCTPQPDPAVAGMDTLTITTSCISLQANEAIYGSGHWTTLAGSGGSIQDTSLASSLFCGIPGQTYLLEWSVRNNCGISRDTVRVGFAVIPFACGDTFTDSRDGQHYPSVDIGGQCWMAANLNAGNLVSGNTAQSDNGVVERYCYANQVSNCLQYGGLYQWDEAMGYATGSMVQGICPDGWHLPSHAEWIALETYLGGPNQAGAALKESGTTHWAVPNSGADNSSGFTALPGGYRNTNGGFYLMPYQAYFWTASEDNTSGAWGVNLSYDLSKMVRGSHLKAFGYSVRCVKD